jgi:adenylate cyclase
MSPERTERRLAAIMFTDIVGYTALMAESEQRGRRLRERHRELVRPLAGRYHGEVVDENGDELVLCFPSALDAVHCALVIQAELADDAELQLRIGIHSGDVVFEGERVYGDGVNVASRIRPLAEPGGVCISDEVQHSIRNQPDIDATPLGEHELKNVGRPVAVYEVTGKVDPPHPAAGLEEPAAGDVPLPGMDELTVPGFGDAHAIAVLPFDNLSADAEQEYFADGLAEDLITRLAAARLPVIARNSSFTYKGEPVDVKRVSRELGVRYVVEGSVRRAGERVRISAQLIDATTGQHVWAERYDRALGDLFEVQDEVTAAIGGCLVPEWMRSEGERAARKAPESLDAWESFQRGVWHALRMTREDNALARSFCERATELDPNSSAAFASLAMACLNEQAMAWSDDPSRSLAEGLRAAQKAVALDDEDPNAHVAMCWAHNASGQQDKAIAARKLAIQLNPSMPLGYAVLGFSLVDRRPDEALVHLHTAMRLSPRDPNLWLWLFVVALVHFGAGRYEEAVAWAQRSLQRRPSNPASYPYLIAGYAHLEKMDEAQAALAELLQLEPDASIARFRISPFPHFAEISERLIDGLRKAGLPEE